MRTLPIVTVVAAVLVLAGCSVDHSPDAEFKTQVMGHYGEWIDNDAWPQVISAAHQSCDRLTGINPPPWAANLLVIETQGANTEERADHIARAGVDIYCPQVKWMKPAS
ncbi:DUF732 domain-containing protein [Pseudonocardia alni]|uniref:DUF732 domain-containing protein n=1 Tax=Pseudonocardia alni TaxID=33907 RepID=UPI00280AC01E|nr:DUF732 domain-containing protein [Pseudonocardia alni]